MGANVDWTFARTVAGRVAGQEPFAQSYHMASLEADLLELTAQAETLVEETTGLVSAAGPARAAVTDRLGWVDANLASFERLLRPLLLRLNGERPDPADGDDPTIPGGSAAAGVARRSVPGLGPLAPIGRALSGASAAVGGAVGPKVAGAELGALLGWMSGRVLGQYDLLITEDDRPEDQDWVYYVGPNVLALEKRYGFAPREFRLWLAVHECTHRAQFTGVPWLRPYFLSLVNELLDAIDPDPGRVMDMVGGTVRDLRRGDGPSLRDGGLSALFATPEQRQTMQKVSGLMSLLEGHGDIIMDRATRDLVPSQQRFARVMTQRRQNASGLGKVIQRVTGIEAKLAQYEEGEHFVRQVEAAGGQSLFDEVWASPESLPTIAEIREPERWVSRLRAPAGA